MTYTATISPDYNPNHLAGWYIFNTWVQKQLDIHCHFELLSSFEEQTKAINSGSIDLIYANPFAAATLIREHGFLPVATAEGKQDETIIATAEESPLNSIDDLTAGLKIATTNSPEVHLMGMIMLESADLNSRNCSAMYQDNFVLVAKQLLQGKADIGFFLKAAYENLSGLVTRQLKVLLTSEINVIQHTLLIAPSLQEHHQALTDALVAMPNNPSGASCLASMELTGWSAVQQEEAEFMIDLMDTLVVE